MAARPSGSSAPRIQLLDFIRFMAMVLMVEGHTLEAFLRPQDIRMADFGWNAWVGLRGLTAPLFLMVSGAASGMGRAMAIATEESRGATFAPVATVNRCSA